jgi:hypothetical protein
VPDLEFSDDPTIPDDADLWRRILPTAIVFDESTGDQRPASMAFEDHPDGSPMSVVIAAECAGPGSVLAGHEGFGLAPFKAGLARQCGLGVARDPTPEEPAHAVVIGRETKSISRRLAEAWS